MLTLPAELTQNQASACLLDLKQGIKAESGAAVVVDAQALVRFDSSALAVLLECRRETLALGKGFSVHQASERLKDLAALYGIGELLPAA